MIVGKLVQSAAKGIQQTLRKSAFLKDDYTPEQFRTACREYIAGHGTLKCYARYEAPADVFWDDEKYRGEAYAAFAWAGYVAEVTVDLTPYSVTVDDFVALQKIAKVLHPDPSEDRITGDVAQANAFASDDKVACPIDRWT